jgi:hypothetical protein
MQFVRQHGIVTESARGSVPSLAEAIAGSPIRGSWWSHPRADAIFQLSRTVRDHPDVLVCRVVRGKVTFVHRRLWSALVRLASVFPASALADVSEIHASSGKHIVRETPFPKWVPVEILSEAQKLTEAKARMSLAALFRGLAGVDATRPITTRSNRTRRKRRAGYRKR